MATNQAVATFLLRVKEEGAQALKGVGKSLDDLKVKAGLVSAAFTGFLVKSVNSYAVAEKSVNSLNAALRAQGLDVGRLSKKYQDLASAIQKKTVFGDEDIVQALSLGQSLAGNIEITEDLIKATVDFAAANEIDLKSAFSLVGKSIGSNINGLARYGIEIDTSASRSDKLATITESLSLKFDGFAEAQAQGLGKIKQFQNAFGDLFEVVGQKLAPVVEKLAEKLTDFVVSLQTDELAGWAATIAVVVAGVTGLAAVLGTLISIAPVVAAGFTTIGSAFTFMLGPLGLVTAGIAALITIWSTDFLGVQEITFGVINAISNLFTNFVENSSKLFSGFGGILKGIFTLDPSEIKSSFNSLKQTLGEVKDSAVQSYKEGFSERKTELNKTLKQEVTSEKKNQDEIEKAKQKRFRQEALDKKALEQKKAEEEKKQIEKIDEQIKEVRNQQKETEFSDIDEIYQYRLDTLNRLKADEKSSQLDIKRAELELERAILDVKKRDIEEEKQSRISAFQKVADFTKTGFKGIAQAGVSAFADTLVPGAGQAAGQIFEFFSQGTEQFKEQLTSIFSADFIQNIINNFIALFDMLPGLIDGLVKNLEENLPALVQKFVEAFIGSGPEITTSILRSFADPKFQAGIGAAFVKGVIAGFADLGGDFSEAFKKAIADATRAGFTSPEIFSNLSASLGTAFNDVGREFANFFRQSIPEAFKQGIEEIRSFFSNAIVDAFDSAFNRIRGSLAALFDIGQNIANSFTAALGNFKEVFSNTIIDAFNNAFLRLRDTIRDILKIDLKIDTNLGGGGGGGGFVQQAKETVSGFFGRARGGRVPAFAQGGMIPDLSIPRFEFGGIVDDTLIRATRGEAVTNASSTAANADLLNEINNSNGRSVSTGNNISIVVNGGLLGDRESARQFARAVDDELYRLRQGNESRSFDTGLT